MKKQITIQLHSLKIINNLINKWSNGEWFWQFSLIKKIPYHDLNEFNQRVEKKLGWLETFHKHMSILMYMK